MICEECRSEIKPCGLLFGQVPGMSCNCSWEELTRKEFRQIFGFAFHARKIDERGTVIGNIFVAHGRGLSGNSKQRRKQRRERRHAS